MIEAEEPNPVGEILGYVVFELEVRGFEIPFEVLPGNTSFEVELHKLETPVEGSEEELVINKLEIVRLLVPIVVKLREVVLGEEVASGED